jgi:hypothetical protein
VFHADHRFRHGRARAQAALASCAFLLILTVRPAVVHAQPADVPREQQDHQHHAAPAPVPLFSAREASGTAWLPDETPGYGFHRQWRGWDVMLHGHAVAQFLYEPGERHRTGGFSEAEFGSVNWGMAMARRQVGAARVGVRAMVSLESWTIAGCGYISYLSTGEICDGDTIHDRQHPHDFLMELAAEYDRPVRGSLRWQVYGGLSGEPALGPAGFPHRTSAAVNPIAPIAHHWLDATHITFGVITAGVYDRTWKLETSLFNGREPDEDRAGVELEPLDSFSARLTWLPTPRVAWQVSSGRLHEAEPAFPPDPRVSVARTTTSITWHAPRGDGGVWATTLAYGLNREGAHVHGGVVGSTLRLHAGLLESTLTLGGGHTAFGRAELVGMPAHELHAHEYDGLVFTVAKLQAGYVRQLPAWRGLTAGVGGSATVSLLPEALRSRYGGRAAPGFALFLTVRPPSHDMAR